MATRHTDVGYCCAIHATDSRIHAPTATPVTFAGAYADDVSVRLLVADASAPVLAKNVAP